MGTAYNHLDIDERYELFRLHDAGIAQKEIAVLMNRSEHSISHVSIYRYIYRPKVRPQKLHRYLARAKASRGRRYFKRRASPWRTGALFTSGQKRRKSARNSAIGKTI